jgi:hypothetical protein
LGKNKYKVEGTENKELEENRGFMTVFWWGYKYKNVCCSKFQLNLNLVKKMQEINSNHCYETCKFEIC